MLIEQTYRYTPEMLRRPDTGGIDVVSTLEHFSIITYSLEPERLQAHLAPRFEPVCARLSDGTVRALMSVVPFRNTNFHSPRFPLLRASFGQTNYRAYVLDRETGKQAAWFFGTTLDSASVAIPRYLWKLPWHPGRMRFSCEWAGGRYTCYAMQTKSAWASVELELEDTGAQVAELDGFPDLETGRVLLTHPLVGFYFRRDGAPGSYPVWHDRLMLTVGQCRRARFDLLDRLDLVCFAAQGQPHSVLIQPKTEFTIYLPPRKLC